MRRSIFVMLLLVAGSVFAAEEKRPNIVFIMSDDHAAHAISAYGSKINKTPFLDKVANEGMRFDKCFVTNSICTPSRAVILTGKYSHINGVPVFNNFDGSQPTVAKYLQAAGYYTGMVGKWHLGSDPTGFDSWCILPGQGAYFDPTFIEAKGRHQVNGYVTDIITDKSIDFLQNRPKDKPFYLMVHHKAPHRAWEPNEKYKALFATMKIPEPATLRDDYASRSDAVKECLQKVFTDMTRRDLKLVPPAELTTPPEKNKWLNAKPKSVEITVDGKKKVLEGEELNSWKYQRYMQDYLACVQSVDDNVGRLADWLDKNNLRENTIVIYTSDQGFFLGDHGLYDKRFMYEASLHMPFIIRWPAAIKAGGSTNAMIINADFAPTFMEAAGLPVPADMQGKSIVPILKGNTPADWRKSMYYRYYHDPGDHNTRAHYGVRTETHKLIYFWKKNQWEMYDLVSDPDEMKNLINDPAQQKKVEELKTELARLKKELKDEDQFANEQPNAGVDGQGGANPKKPAKQPPAKTISQSEVTPGRSVFLERGRSHPLSLQEEANEDIRPPRSIPIMLADVGEAPKAAEAPEGMIWIKAGTFNMGSKDFPDAQPVHPVKLDGYFMDKTTVTNAQFTKFVEATKYVTVAERRPDPKDFPGVPAEALVPGSIVFTPPKEAVPLNDVRNWWAYVPGANWRHPEGPASDLKDKDHYPVVQVCYEDAAAYAKWAGKRLPTEAEFEYAARGGLDQKEFVWGEDMTPKGKHMANIWQGNFPNINKSEDGFVLLSPVASFPANGFGLYDMSGNCWQWCADWYRPDTYAKSAGENPKGPDSSFDPDEPQAAKRVQRGGSFMCCDQYCKAFRPGARGKGEVSSAAGHIGFRCVMSKEAFESGKK